MIKDIDKKTKEILVEDFSKFQREHNTLECEQYNVAIMAKSAQDIEKSINQFNNTVDVLGKKSDELSKKVFWLNIILTIATVVGAVATFISVFKKG